MKFLIMLLSLMVGVQALATSPQKPTSVTLALNWKAEPEFGGFYAASLENLYQKENLQVKIIEGGSGTPTIQMLANGKVDFAIVSSDEIILSQDRNPKNKVIALFSVYQTAPYIIMTHAERNFKSLREVFQSEGILSIQAGLPYYQYLINKFGTPKVKVVPYLGGVANFLNDKKFSQQGFLTTEPLSAEKSGAKVKNFLIADEGFNPYLVVLAVREETLKKNPDLIKKMMTATHLGWESYLKDPKKTNEYMATLNKSLDLETFNKAAEVQVPLIASSKDKLGSMTEERWAKLIEQMKELKQIRSTPKASDMFLK